MKTFTKPILLLSVMCIILSFKQSFSQFNTLLYDNGPFITAYGAASNGLDHYSEVQDDLGMNINGVSCGGSYLSLSDDFEVTGDWDIESFTFYAFQDNTGNTSTLNEVRVQIWDGDPSISGSSVIWGNINGENLIISTDWTHSWRVLQSNPVQDIAIMEIVADVSGLSLTPGEYWVEYAIEGTEPSGTYSPFVTILGQTTTGNSLLGVNGGWDPNIDVGPQGLPFLINGTITMGAQDLAITEIISPNTGTALGMQDVTINILNAGYLTQTIYDVSYIVADDTVTETIFNTINSLESFEYTFTVQADLSAFGIYTIKACVHLSEDQIPGNDCSSKLVENLEPTMCIPEYEEGCSSGHGFVDFTLEQIENIGTDCAENTGTGWSQYFDLGPAELLTGETHTIFVQSGHIMNYASVWIDFNDDLEFSDDEKMVDNYELPDAGEFAEMVFTVPSGAQGGIHYMRARTNYNEACNSACEKYFQGETEDYLVDIHTNVSVDKLISNSFKLFPNPAKELVYIESDINIDYVQILNVSGQLVFEQTTNGNNAEIHISNLGSGLYFVKIFSKDKVSVKKLMIE